MNTKNTENLTDQGRRPSTVPWELELCSPHSDYAEIFFSWRQEATTLKFNPIKQITVEETRDQLKKSKHELTELCEKEQYRWFFKIDGELVGQIGMNGVNNRMGTAEIGYTVGEKFQGRGIATVAVGLILDKIFSETKIRRIIAYVHEENVASCRVLEKLGFMREGLLREHYIVNGAPANEVIFGVLRSDWMAV